MTDRKLLRHMVDAGRVVGTALDHFHDRVAPPDADSIGHPENVARGTILFGVWTTILIFGVFGLWAAIAPLDSAAVAMGQVVLDSNKKTIQHLEGGIIEEILVKEGETVKKDQPLVRLNATSSKAQLDLYRANYLSAKAAETRLLAERNEKDKLEFPKILTDLAGDPKVAEYMDNETRYFKSRRETLEGQVGILKQKIAQSKQEMNGLNAQVTSATNQIALLNEQIAVVETLLAQGNAVKPRLLALKQQVEQLKGQRGSNQAMISRAEQTITESQLEISNQKTDFMNKVSAELKDTQSKISDLEERIRASADVVNRITITSPIAGRITGLNVHTVGGVIQPGEKLMDIVPLNDKLIVESQVSPQDIDVVRTGLPARVRLTAYKTRRVPLINGVVVNVSADKFVDNRTGASYYLARVEVNAEELARLKNVELTPGMPAQVLIVTGQRTLLQYLMGPISDAMMTAFREQ